MSQCTYHLMNKGVTEGRGGVDNGPAIQRPGLDSWLRTIFRASSLVGALDQTIPQFTRQAASIFAFNTEVTFAIRILK